MFVIMNVVRAYTYLYVCIILYLLFTCFIVRSNKLTYLPDEIGRIPRLRVLTLSDNEIKVLPYSLMNLKELQALWLAENQVLLSLYISLTGHLIVQRFFNLLTASYC